MTNYLINTNIAIDFLKGEDYSKTFILTNQENIYYCQINEKELLNYLKLSNKEKLIIKFFLSTLNKVSIKKDSRIFDIYSTLVLKYQYLNEHQNDALLAALAILKDFTFVTRNRKHFEKIDELKKLLF